MSLSPGNVRHRPRHLQEVSQPLGPAEGEGRSLQHSTPAWSSCRGVRKCHSDPEEEISLSQLDKLSLLSQGVHRLVGQGTGSEVPVNMNG